MKPKKKPVAQKTRSTPEPEIIQVEKPKRSILKKSTEERPQEVTNEEQTCMCNM